MGNPLEGETCNGEIELGMPELPSGITGSWSSNNGGSIADYNSNVTKVTGLKKGQTVFTWKIQNSDKTCTASQTYTVDNKGAGIVALSADKTVACGKDDEITIKAEVSPSNADGF